MRDCISWEKRFNYPIWLVTQQVPPITPRRAKEMGIYGHKNSQSHIQEEGIGPMFEWDETVAFYEEA